MEVPPPSTSVDLPPGFRFHPSDEEIVGYYLKNKVAGIKIKFDVIREIDLYKCEPWDLPEKSFLPSRDLEWYFFSPRDKKYPNGSRSNRATGAGYWKATGKDRKVSSQSNKIGMKKTLVFYRGRAPNGERTDWLMHEYRLDESQCKEGDKDQYVLCRVFKKGKQGSFNPDSYGEENREMYLPLLKNTCTPPTASEDDVEEFSEGRSSPAMADDEPLASSFLPSETSSEVIENKADDNNCVGGSIESIHKGSEIDSGMMPSPKGDSQTRNQPEEENIAQYFESYALLEDQFDTFLPLSFGTNYQLLSSMPYLFDDYDTANIDNLFHYEDVSNDIPCLPDDIKIVCRPRSEQYEHAQQFPDQGSAHRRILLQMQKFKAPLRRRDTAVSEIIIEDEDLDGCTSESSDLEDEPADLHQTMESKQNTRVIMKPGSRLARGSCQALSSDVKWNKNLVSAEKNKPRKKLEENSPCHLSVVYLQGASESGLTNSDTTHCHLELQSSAVSGLKNLPSNISACKDNPKLDSNVSFISETSGKNDEISEDKDTTIARLRMRKRSDESIRSYSAARKAVDFTDSFPHLCAREAKKGFFNLLKLTHMFRLLLQSRRKLTKHAGGFLVLTSSFFVLLLLVGSLTTYSLGRNLFPVTF
eukprot:TRINITY_DN11004_c0_g2_i1.p1 TRINITY_DN11004_c0_g2~~TRINITY_DN11004_c0_g2_i1.p1  ORF type:complete len:643 (+),score=135.94 TRINITY_DN11004_c0_g2_i1:590-2518(+)